MNLYGIPNCGSVKKARTFLESQNLSYTFYDLKTHKLNIAQIRSWAEKVGIDVLLNKKGTTYKKLELSKLNLSDKDKIQKMLEHPLLIKRPIIEFKDSVIVGFDEQKYKDIFL